MALRYLNDSQFDSGVARLKYPNPYFDLSKNYIPRDIKSLFKWCKIFYYKNEFINQVITKMAEYPITDIQWDGGPEPEIKRKYDIMFKHYLKIKSLLRDIGLDYYTFGNSFIITSLDFKRFLKCNTCNQTFLASDCSDKEIKFSNNAYEGICKNCKTYNKAFEISDKQLSEPTSLKFIRLNPENIDIEFNSVNNHAEYYLTVDSKIKKAVNGGNRSLVDKLPEIFLEAAKQGKKIKLDKNNLYHFKASTLAEDDMGWGKSPLLPSLGIIWYNQTLRRANEAIAAEHILPKRYLSPATNAAPDPFAVDLGRWRASMEDQLQKWRKDENHVAIMPIPVNAQSLGGDGKILMLHQELRLNEESIINSLGVPIEFIKGGASWTGSSVSLRIVENRFLNYREDLLDFVNYFVLAKINAILGYPIIKAKFKELRMADDSETKDLALRVAQQGWLSPSYVVDKLGFDIDLDKQMRLKDTEFDNYLSSLRANAQAQAQGKAQEILARSQIKANHIMEELEAAREEGLFSEELAVELRSNKEEVSSIIRKLTVQLTLMPPETQPIYLQQLQNAYPLTAGFVLKRLQISQQFSPNGEEQNKEQPTETTKTVEKKKHVTQSGSSKEITTEKTTEKPVN